MARADDPVLIVPRLWVERVVGAAAEQFRSSISGQLDVLFISLVASYVYPLTGQWRRVRESVVIAE